MNRLVFPETDYLLLATDLHGCFVDYQTVLQYYEKLLAVKKSVSLILMGDLLHAYPDYPDDSLTIITDVMHRQKKGENIIYLMGNHEIAFVLQWELCKGQINFSRHLEKDLQEKAFSRQRLCHYLCTLPFAAGTKNGIVISHTGVSAVAAQVPDERWSFFLSLRPFHLWLQNLNFTVEFPDTFCSSDSFHPVDGEKNLDLPAGKILWEFFMNKNEYSYPKNYEAILNGTLNMYAKITPANILVSGHIEEKSGFKIPAKRHLRIHTGRGGKQTAGKMLLIEQKQAINEAADLVSNLKGLKGTDPYYH